MPSALITLCRFLPLNALSFFTGWLVQLQLPSVLNYWLCSIFVQAFGIDMSEAERPLKEYRSIEEVFTRRLKPGARQIMAEICSPADGMISHSNAAVNNKAVQVKGIDYPLDELVFGKAAPLQAAWYTTVYLAPHNYHRVHSPVSGRLVAMRYIPGKLWPVNDAGVRYVPQLFVQNERIVFDIEVEGGGKVFVAMVGALNVGRIQPAHAPDFFTNDAVARRHEGVRDLEIDPVAIKAGDELGTFMLGSTVVVVFDEKAADGHQFSRITEKQPIRMGEPLISTGA